MEQNMDKNPHRLCPFCEGMIDYLADECPYCGTFLETLCEKKEDTFIPLYTPKSHDTLIKTESSQIQQENANLAIVVGGSIAPFAIFLWLLGENGNLSFTIKTSCMPFVSLLGFLGVFWGFFVQRTKNL